MGASFTGNAIAPKGRSYKGSDREPWWRPRGALQTRAIRGVTSGPCGLV